MILMRFLGWMRTIHMCGVEANSVKIVRYITTTTTSLNVLIVGCLNPRISNLLTT
jgi:hypothetical protein